MYGSAAAAVPGNGGFAAVIAAAASAAAAAVAGQTIHGGHGDIGIAHGAGDSTDARAGLGLIDGAVILAGAAAAAVHTSSSAITHKIHPHFDRNLVRRTVPVSSYVRQRASVPPAQVDSL